MDGMFGFIGARLRLRAGLVRTAVALAALGLWAVAFAGSAVAAPPAFAPVTGSPFATGSGLHSGPASVAFSSTGLLAAANSSDGTVSVFTVGSGGALAAVTGSPFATGRLPSSVAFSPSGGLLATANSGDSTVSVFKVGSDGALTAVTGSPFASAAPASVAFSSSGGLLAAVDDVGNTVWMFKVDSNGALTPVTGSPFATGRSPRWVAFSSTGLLATANIFDNTVSVFKVDSDGQLAAVPGSPFATRDTRSVAFSPSGGLLATANGNGNTVSVFTVGSDNTLNAVTGSPFATGGLAASVAFSPSGGLLATANAIGNTVAVFAVGSDGQLNAVSGSPFGTGVLPASVAFGPVGGLFATANVGDGTVSVFAPTATSTQTIVASAPNPALASQQLTLTATVSPAPDGGTVAFDDGSGVIAGCGAQTVDPASATASCQTSSLTVGTHSITALYSGDPGFAGSTSAAVSETVLADSPQNLGNLTLQDVESSARFQALPPALQKVTELLANHAIAQLAGITPRLTAAQLARLVTAYKQGVAGLQSQGYLTAAQASTLDGLADHIQP